MLALHDLGSCGIGVIALFVLGGAALAAASSVMGARAIAWFAPLVVVIGVIVTLVSARAWTSDADVTRYGAPAYFEIVTDARSVSLVSAFADCVFWTGLAAVLVAWSRSLLPRT